MDILLAVIALVAGCAIGFLCGRIKSGDSKTRIGVLESQLEEVRKSSESRVAAIETARKTALAERDASWQSRLDDINASWQSRLEESNASWQMRVAEKDRLWQSRLDEMESNHRQALETQRKNNADALEALQGRFDETVAKMKAELENATSEMLKKRQSEFESSSREGVSKILEPLNQNITEMRKAVNENTIKHTEIGGQLSSNIRLVMEHSDAARKSADRLADALRGGGKIQGDWGETVLTELLESQGLEQGIHFDTQASIRDAAGNLVLTDADRRLRPDVILHLDRERDIIIDAKVSLSAYLDYMNAETDELRTQALKNHVASVESHVNELSKKDYTAYVQPPKVRMNYVIMFVPNSAALFTATSARPELWRKAMEKGVYIADEQTLYAALKIINMTWRQIAQAENHEKVFALANEMLDRVNMFMEKFVAVGKRIEDAQKSYNDAFLKVKDSGQSIPTTCAKLIRLGAGVKPRKGVTPDLLGLAPTTTD